MVITVITGPPCAGKSTYARNNALPGDIIIDFDALATALGSTERHDHPDHVREVTAAAWDKAIRRTLELRRTAWIIDSQPTPARRAAYDNARVRYVSLTADEAELHRRAEQDNRTATTHHRITRWLTGRDDPKPARRTTW